MKYLGKLSLRSAPVGAHLCESFFKTSGGGTMLGAAVSGIINSTLGQLLGRSNMRKQNEYARQNMAISNEYNRQNAMEQGVLKRMSLQGAGLNINSENGSFAPVGSSVPAQTAPQQNPNVGLDMSALTAVMGQQIEKEKLNIMKPYYDAMAQDVKATADLKNRELKGKQEADSIFANGSFEGSITSNPDGTDNFTISYAFKPITTREGFEATKDWFKFVRSEIPKIDAERVQSQLQKIVTEQQISSGLTYYLAYMDYMKFANLYQAIKTSKALEGVYFQNVEVGKSEVSKNHAQADLFGEQSKTEENKRQNLDKQGELFVAEKELKELEKMIQENSNLGAIWEELSNKFDSGDYLGALGSMLKAIFFGVMGNLNINFGFSKSKSKNTNKSSSSNTTTVHHHSHGSRVNR